MSVWVRRIGQALAAVACVASTAVTVRGQTIECVYPTSCKAKRVGPEQTVIVQVIKDKVGVANELVTFAATKPGMKDAAVRTDANGFASGSWKGDDDNEPFSIHVASPGAASVEIKLETDAPTYVVLSAPEEYREHWYDGVLLAPNEWYQGRQIRRPYRVRVTASPLKACDKVAVALHGYGDKPIVVPDTAYATIQVGTKGDTLTCEARFYWTLASGVGRQVLRATLVSDKSQMQEVVARSRALPWIGLGVALSYDSKFYTTSQSEQLYKFTRKVVASPGDTIVVAYDTTIKTNAVPDTSAAKWSSIPVVAVNFPLAMGLPWLRTSIAADLTHPDRNFFAGLSVLQLTSGWLQEDIGLDLHLVAHWARREVVTNIEACTRATTPAKCDVKTRYRPVGAAALFMVNTSSVFEKLVSALSPAK